VNEEGAEAGPFSKSKLSKRQSQNTVAQHYIHTGTDSRDEMTLEDCRLHTHRRENLKS
jgi:hypothetical protein